MIKYDLDTADNQHPDNAAFIVEPLLTAAVLACRMCLTKTTMM